jgi:hypothetical protein
MGCLKKSISDWEREGILNSNLIEFPNDGSQKSKNREMSFNHAMSIAKSLWPYAKPLSREGGGK